MNNNAQSAVDCLITKAQLLSGDFSKLLNKSSNLLDESQQVNQKLIDCCGVQDDQLLKNLVKYCNNEDRINELLENAELKQTVEEYKAGVQLILEKYMLHCKGNILNERYNLRTGYIAKLQEVVDSLDKRIEEMLLIMTHALGMQEQTSNENQRTIQQLAKENQMMRNQLQINSGSEDKDCFEQALPESTESSTQVEQSDDLDTISTDSSAFQTCFEWSPVNSVISESDVSSFIEEVLHNQEQ